MASPVGLFAVYQGVKGEQTRLKVDQTGLKADSVPA